MVDGYPFVFVMNDRHASAKHLEYVIQYRFRSERSKHTYIVRVEKYERHSYCLKFFDKSNRNSNSKYNLRTNTFEPRTILYTIYHIMLDVLQNDDMASFFFIGAEDERDVLGASTRRYRVYRRFVSSVVSDRVFQHYRVNDMSLYILVNKYSIPESDRDRYVNDIVMYVKEAFTHET